MKFLIDAQLPKRLAVWLIEAGHGYTGSRYPASPDAEPPCDRSQTVTLPMLADRRKCFYNVETLKEIQHGSRHSQMG